MKKQKKDFYTNRWLALDTAVYLLATAIGLTIGAATFWGTIVVFGLEDRAAGNFVVAAVVAVLVITSVITMIGTIAIYDMVVEWRYGRERGLLRRAVSYTPFTRA